MVTHTDEKLSDSWKENPGVGTKVIAVPFVPELIKLEFTDEIKNDLLDTLDYSIEYKGLPNETYRFTINWSLKGGDQRRIRYTIAKLSNFGGIG
jgi:hypothetical protein